MRFRGIWIGAGAALALGITLALATALGLRAALAPLAESAPEVLFSVQRGQSLGSVARNLEASGLVRSARALEWMARLRDLAGALHAGEYRLSAAMAPEEILDRIARGQVATWELVVPEGFTAAQIAARLEARGLASAAGFSAVVADPDSAAHFGLEGQSLEGYLFPETYRLPRGLPPLELARAFTGQFLAVWSQLAPSAAEQSLSMHQVVTLASIVEKETGAPDERPLIASVFRNRLARGMRLESDPTVIYGIPDFDGNLRRRDLEDEANPYNTYRIPGLPPGPIANPGADALRAVVEPAESDYLYFVSRNDGTHVFSRTYREHLEAVERYQRRAGRPAQARQASSPAPLP